MKKQLLRATLFTLALFLLSAAAPAAAQVCNVTPNGTTEGTDWANATTLQAALSNTACATIRIKQGTYNGGFSFGRRLVMSGGYTGVGDSKVNDPSHTILNGGGPVLGINGITYDNGQDYGARAYLGPDTVVSDLTIQNGNIVGGTNGGGAGVRCNGSGSSHCRLTFRNVVFKNNSTNQSGGAVWLFAFNGGNTSPTFENVSFIDNTAGRGGGLAIQISGGMTASPIFRNVTFKGNKTTVSLPSYAGGAISVRAPSSGSYTSHLQIDNSTFINNIDHYTSALGLAGGSSSSAPASKTSVTIRNSIWEGSVYIENASAASVNFKNTFSSSPSWATSFSCPVSTTSGTCTGVNAAGDAKLTSPSIFGGRGPTILLPRNDSPVLDKIPSAECLTTFDARNVSRPQNGLCDYGAVERRYANGTLLPMYPMSVTVVNEQDGGGAVNGQSASFSAEVEAGDEIELIATPNGSSEFVGWDAQGACASAGAQPQCTVSMNEAKSVTATFRGIHYPIHYSVTGNAENGSLDSCPSSALKGSTVTCTPVMATGYYARFVSGCQTNGLASCSLTNVQGAAEVEVQYLRHSYAVNLNVVGTGGVSNGCTGNGPGDGTIYAGEIATCIAVPNEGYSTYFQNTSTYGSANPCVNSDSLSTNSCQLNVTGPSARTIYARFALKYYTITVQQPPRGGSVSCSTNYVGHGGNVTCSITVSNGYYLDSISGCNHVAGQTQCTITGATGPVTVIPSILPNRYNLSGTVTNLNGVVELELQSGQSVLVSSASVTQGFIFDQGISHDDAYAVTVKTQPEGQTCTVLNGTGTGVSGDVTGVLVNCETSMHAVGGIVSGLLGQGLSLSLNVTGSEPQVIFVSANGSFQFPTTLAYATAYTIDVAIQPTSPKQVCSVIEGTGQAGVGGLVASVSCVTEQHLVSTQVIGEGAFDVDSLYVQDMQTGSFSVTADMGWQIETVSGCGGSLNGSTFTTGSVTAPCTVTATFKNIPHTIELVSGNHQEAKTYSTFELPLSVRVINEANQPVVGVSVGFSTQAGAASLSQSSVVTDAQGVASVVVTATDHVGAFTVSAQQGSLSSVLFNLETLPRDLSFDLQATQRGLVHYGETTHFEVELSSLGPDTAMNVPLRMTLGGALLPSTAQFTCYTPNPAPCSASFSAGEHTLYFSQMPANDVVIVEVEVMVSSTSALPQISLEVIGGTEGAEEEVTLTRTVYLLKDGFEGGSQH